MDIPDKIVNSDPNTVAQNMTALQSLAPSASETEEHTRIIIIEQDVAIAAMLQWLLGDEAGYDVMQVSTPIEAFETLRLAPGDEGYAKWPPDLIMFDITVMDDHNRRTLKRIIESHRNWPPTIMLSDLPTGDMEGILQTNENKVILVRPFDLDAVLDSVQAMLCARC